MVLIYYVLFHLNRTIDNTSSGGRNPATTWRRRGAIATTEARRDIYRQNLYVNPESVLDTTGRYRETSPAWFRYSIIFDFKQFFLGSL